MSRKSSPVVSRLLKTVATLFVLIGLLVSFPNVQPIVLLLGIVAYIVFRKRNASAFSLIAVAIICALKFPFFSISLIACVSAMCIVGTVHLCAAEKPNLRYSVWVIVLSLCWIVYSVDTHIGQHTSKKIVLNPESTIACIGDSLTDFGYPDVLGDIVGCKIADYGNDGYDTAMALKLMPEILAQNPSVAVIELGGHDYNQNLGRAHAEKNLRKMIRGFQDADVAVVLVEIPRGFIYDPYFGLERQLARELDLELIPDTLIRGFVFWSPIIPPGMMVSEKYHLSNDGLHPNKAGNLVFAKAVKHAIERMIAR